METDDHPYLIRTTERRGTPVLELGGEVDLTAMPPLTEALRVLLATERSFSVDLSRVDYIDSAGLQALVRALRDQRAAGRDVVFLDPSEPVARVLEMIGLDLVATIEPGPDAAGRPPEPPP